MLPRLRDVVPTVPTLLARAGYAKSTDWKVRAKRQESADELARFNADAGECAAAMMKHGCACPHCAAHRHDHILKPAKLGRTFFLCRVCSRSFAHVDVVREDASNSQSEICLLRRS